MPTPPAAPAAPAFPGVPEGVSLREFSDAGSMRKNVYDASFKALQNLPPVSNRTHTLRLVDPQWADPETRTARDREEAILRRQSLGRRVRGTWELVDNATSQVVDRRTQIVAQVPHFSEHGTTVLNGVENAVRNQSRLDPGVYVRRRSNGEYEAHVALMPREGISHKIGLDPRHGTFHLELSQAKIPLLPLLQAMGVTDEQIDAAWGKQVAQSNREARGHGALSRLAQKILPAADHGLDEASRTKKVAETYANWKISPFVSKHTLGAEHDRLGPETLLTATARLLEANRTGKGVVNRDSLAFQRIFGPEDLLAERLTKDSAGLQKKLLYKAAKKGSLAAMPSGALSPQLEHVITKSGLGQALEEINISEFLDKMHSITRLGEGGMPGVDAIPDESRNVQNSHYGFIDPIRTPETLRAGVDLSLASGARKGSDGRVYAKFRDAKTGQMMWRSPQDLAGKVVGFHESAPSKSPYVIGVRNEEVDLVPRKDVEYWGPPGSQAFSPLSDAVPRLQSSKGQRNAMGGRMLTQALALKDAEAPLVRTVDEETGKDYVTTFGTKFGAVRPTKPGRVLAVTEDGIDVQYHDGEKETLPLYRHMPFNRKSLITQTPLVAAGSSFAPGQLLARSNYTDKDGTLAVGKNLKTGYMPWAGYNHNDAVVMSESGAKKLSSEHAYQHELEVDPRTRTGKRNFVDIYPGRFSRAQLDQVGDDGVIKVGAKVAQGQPLIVAARENVHAPNRVHRRKEKGFTDASVVWDHQDEGEVVKVAQGKSGPVVVVRSFQPTKEADKIAGLYGDKGVIAKIVPDHLMPHDADGEPFELLLSDQGLISRTNAAQALELGLSKIAKKTGRPYLLKDFDDATDAVDHLKGELQKNGLEFAEEVYDPVTNARPKIAAGHRYVMKLHHTAESKGQARSGGSYNADDVPAKGGYAGCFTWDTPIDTIDGQLPIGAVVENRLDVEVPTRAADMPAGLVVLERVTDWFEYDAPAILTVITFDDGTTIETTPGHEFALACGKKTAARNLLIDDEVQAHGPPVTDGPPLPRSRFAGAERPRHAPAAGVHAAADELPAASPGRAERRDPAHPGPSAGGRAARPAALLPQPDARVRRVQAARTRQAVRRVVAVGHRPRRPGEKVYDVTVGSTHMYFAGVARVLVSNSKRVSLLDVNALLAHGAYENLRDSSLVRGQRNDRYWLAYMQGFKPPDPDVPTVNKKFVAQLNAAGVDLVPEGKSRLHFMALTNDAVKKRAGDRELKNADTVKMDESLTPVPGGLFDKALTGGHAGEQWAKITLSRPLLNPVMEDPAKKLLGLTQSQFEDVMTGKSQLRGQTGPAAIAGALGAIDVPKAIAQCRRDILGTSRSRRDEAVKRLGYLQAAQRLQLHPREWVLDAVPVLPPAFRRISTLGGKGVPVVADANALYKDLFAANQTAKQLREHLGDDYVGDEDLTTYKAFKAVTGLGDPVSKKSVDRGVRGVLHEVFGSNPKMGTVQRRLISSAVDNVGRATIVPDPDLDMDQIGIPKNLAFDVYKTEIVAELKRNGSTLLNAMQSVKDKDGRALRALQDVMGKKPVIMNRAPVWHKFGIMAFRPKLVAGDAVKIPPLVQKGFGADYDGDAVQFHVPGSEEAVREAYHRMLPSKNLISQADMKSPVHKPEQDYAAGLYDMTSERSKRPVRTFRSKADALAALARRDIDEHTEVEILHEHA